MTPAQKALAELEAYMREMALTEQAQGRPVHGAAIVEFAAPRMRQIAVALTAGIADHEEAIVLAELVNQATAP